MYLSITPQWLLSNQGYVYGDSTTQLHLFLTHHPSAMDYPSQLILCVLKALDQMGCRKGTHVNKIKISTQNRADTESNEYVQSRASTDIHTTHS